MDRYFIPLTLAQEAHIKAYTGTKPDLSQCEWQVGFSWMVNIDDKGKGVDFYVVPILVDRNTKKVYDYFDETNCPFYDRTSKVHIPKDANKDDEDVDFVFNTGTMFP